MREVRFYTQPLPEYRKKPLCDYTDEELAKKLGQCKTPCDECTWLHGCAYGLEAQKRGIVVQKEGNK